MENIKNINVKGLLDYKLFDDHLNKLPKQGKILVNTINQYSYCIAEKDPLFKESLTKADILLPDGIGIVWALKYLKNEKIRKIAGADCHKFLLQYLNKKNGSCFYLGASKETLQKICKKNHTDYPNIRIGSYSPPFKTIFSEEDTNRMLESVREFKPDILFIGMTAPKQEKWAYENFEGIDAKIICSIGAVFDFYAGTVKRPSKLWGDLGLEWLGRLLKEPKRMWKRYLYYGPIFIYYVLRKPNS